MKPDRLDFQERRENKDCKVSPDIQVGKKIRFRRGFYEKSLYYVGAPGDKGDKGSPGTVGAVGLKGERVKTFKVYIEQT